MTTQLDALLKTLKEKRNPEETISVIHSAFSENPHLVATVKLSKGLNVTDKLETAFNLTNTIDSSWWENEGVTPMFSDEGCRSTSVGDMVLIGKTKYLCEPVGWKEV